MQSKMTLDKLAQITAQGFSEMGDKFLKLEKRMDESDKRMEKGFAHVDARLNLLEKEVKEIRQQLNINISKEEYLEIDRRLTIIEEKLAIKL